MEPNVVCILTIGPVRSREINGVTQRDDPLPLIGDNYIYPIYNELHLLHTAACLGGIESELLSLNEIALILYDNQRAVLERTDNRE